MKVKKGKALQYYAEGSRELLFVSPSDKRYKRKLNAEKVTLNGIIAIIVPLLEKFSMRIAVKFTKKFWHSTDKYRREI